MKVLSPRQYVRWQYRYITHHPCDLNNPVRYTEKLQYLRLYVYPNNPEVSRCAGRAGVRDYLKECGLENLLVPVYGIYDRFDDIPFDELPSSFVLKCTHASGWNVLVKDKERFDKEEARKKFGRWLKKDYGKTTLERHYSPIKPQIIVEKFLGDGVHLPTEYKIHVFNGTAKNLYVVTGRGEDIRYTQLYADWTPFDGSQFNGWKKADVTPNRLRRNDFGPLPLRACRFLRSRWENLFLRNDVHPGKRNSHSRRRFLRFRDGKMARYFELSKAKISSFCVNSK